MDLLAVTITIDWQTIGAAAKVAGPFVSLAAVLYLAWKHLPKLKGVVSGWSLPSLGEEDPQVCMMHDWKHLKAELLEHGCDKAEVDKFDLKVRDTVWGMSE